MYIIVLLCCPYRCQFALSLKRWVISRVDTYCKTWFPSISVSYFYNCLQHNKSLRVQYVPTIITFFVPRRCIANVFQKLFLGIDLERFLVDRRFTPTRLSRRRVVRNHNSASRSRWDTSSWKSCITFVSLTRHPHFIPAKKRDRE